MPSLPCAWCHAVKRCAMTRTAKGHEYLCPGCQRVNLELEEHGLNDEVDEGGEA